MILATEKTPSLCHTIPAFEALLERWDEVAMELPAAGPAIRTGMQKLTDYLDQTQDIPAYAVAMGRS
jgi:hypothetical protein